MRIKKLEIVNIGMIKDINKEIDKPLILFYGDIRQGKTTILNAIKLCFGGAFPQDIIRHGEDEAYVHTHFENGSIRREFYINKEGETIARSIQFIKDGIVVKSPVNEIKRFLNPFLIDQDHLQKMSGPDRNRFFIELFGIDTSEEDKEIKELKDEAKNLRIVIKAYGEIDTTKVEEVDILAKKEELEKIMDDHNKEVERVEEINKIPTSHNQTVSLKETRRSELKIELDEIDNWLKSNKRKIITPDPVKPDTSVLEEEISNGKAQNVRYEAYQANLTKQQEKSNNEKSLKEKEDKADELSANKTAKLHEASKNIGIENLRFDEDSQLIYENTTLEMLSTSQLMKLSSELSKLYPEGFGLELIDRGECLGKSIFDFVDKAKKDNTTILATIVGEKPANIPEEIGVYVVEDGELIEASKS